MPCCSSSPCLQRELNQIRSAACPEGSHGGFGVLACLFGTFACSCLELPCAVSRANQTLTQKDLALALLLGARTLLGAPGIATSSKDATTGSWPYY